MRLIIRLAIAPIRKYETLADRLKSWTSPWPPYDTHNAKRWPLYRHTLAVLEMIVFATLPAVAWFLAARHLDWRTPLQGICWATLPGLFLHVAFAAVYLNLERIETFAYALEPFPAEEN